MKSITVRTASCTGCTVEGVVVSQRRSKIFKNLSSPTLNHDSLDCKVNLEGERIGTPGGGLPAPVPCATGILDRQGSVEFADGQSSRWDGERGEEVDEDELAMMGGCYEAPLNAMVRGGKLAWQGDGIWVPESV